MSCKFTILINLFTCYSDYILFYILRMICVRKSHYTLYLHPYLKFASFGDVFYTFKRFVFFTIHI